MILPNLLGLPVAAGDALRQCPEDNVKDTTPTADCILGPAKNAFKPYEAALKQMQWRQQDNPHGRKAPMHWISPPDSTGFIRACLVITPMGANGGRSLLQFQFHDLTTESSASCRPSFA